MIPQMVNRGYDRDFAVNVSITAALVALLVPPSHNLILFSASAGGSISIADLFAAGIVPALLMTLALMITVWIIAGSAATRTRLSRLARGGARVSCPRCPACCWWC